MRIPYQWHTCYLYSAYAILPTIWLHHPYKLLLCITHTLLFGMCSSGFFGWVTLPTTPVFCLSLTLSASNPDSEENPDKNLISRLAPPCLYSDQTKPSIFWGFSHISLSFLQSCMRHFSLWNESDIRVSTNTVLRVIFHNTLPREHYEIQDYSGPDLKGQHWGIVSEREHTIRYRLPTLWLTSWNAIFASLNRKRLNGVFSSRSTSVLT